MNDIKAIDGKLYLMPDFKEIPIDSVMGIMALIRSGKEHISYLKKQLEAEQNFLIRMEEGEKKGIDTAIDSARLCRKNIEETERALFRFNKELKDYEFSLEIAREKEKRTILQEELEKLVDTRYEKDGTEKIEMRFRSHEKLYEALIFSAGEEERKPIEGAYYVMKEIWFFVNSDNATFNGKEIDKLKRPLLVNPTVVGKPEYDKFFEAEITYCSTQNKIKLIERDFISDVSDWVDKRLNAEGVPIARKRKFKEFKTFIEHKGKETTDKPRLTLPQIALIHIYKGERITRESGKGIAEKAGFTSKTSGEKLYQHFTKFFSTMNRKGDAGNERKNRNRMNQIESIVPLLPTDKQQRAKDDIAALKTIIETQ